MLPPQQVPDVLALRVPHIDQHPALAKMRPAGCLIGSFGRLPPSGAATSSACGAPLQLPGC
eukprot:5656001-Alexandrium_andersonii.AAC.1